MNRFRTLLMVGLVLGVTSFALAACEKAPDSASEAKQQMQAAAEDVANSTKDLASSVGELTSDTVKQLGEIAAKLETAPEEAKKLLEEHGWTREEFDAAVKKVKNNEHLAKVFESAKELAGSH